MAKIGAQKEKISPLFFESMKYLSLLGVILFALYIFASPLIARFLHIHVGLVIIAGVTILLACVGTATDGVLRGLKQFHFLGFMSIFSAALKLLLGLGLVLLALKNYGALGGVVGSGVLGFVISLFWVLRLLK